MKVTVIPIGTGTLGIVTKRLKMSLENLEISGPSKQLHRLEY